MIPAKPARHDTGMVLLTVVGAIAVLHFAEAVLMPVALALLLSFLLAPLVQRIERLGAMRAVAVALTCAAAFAIIGALAYVVAHQFIGLIEELPSYHDNLLHKLEQIPGTGRREVERGVQSVQELTDELKKTAPGKPSAPEIAKVQIVEPPPTAAQLVRSLFGPLVGPASTGAIVIVFVLFMLQQREDLRDRLVRLLGASAMHTTVTALDDAAGRVSRYLAMQTLINTIQGTLVAIGLYFIGLPDALLWGALTIVLRFVPYLGPALAAAGPILLSIAFFPGWTETLLVVALIGVLELITNNLLEPRLYGSSVGVSAFALLVAAVFWTWLWGVPGLFLATPLTVCLVVMGKYIPALAFLGVMLGDQPVLEPRERFYQRLLANDPEEAEELLDAAAQDEAGAAPAAICDSLLLPALRFVEHDHDRGAIDASRREAILEQLAELIEEWPVAAAPPAQAANAPVAMKLLCLPAADRADELAAFALVRALAAAGFDAEAMPAALKAEMLERAAETQPDAICISAVPPAAVIHARYLCKKLRARVGAGVPIVVGLWDAHGELAKASERLTAVGADRVVAGAVEAVQVLTQWRRPLEQGVVEQAEAVEAG